jgi:excisionase family DNA binding protein
VKSGPGRPDIGVTSYKELKIVKSPRSTSPILPRLLTVAECADALNMSERTIWRWIEAGELATYRLGRSVRIAERELVRFLERRREQ